MTYSDSNRLETTAEVRAEFAMNEEDFRTFYERNARGVWAYLARVTGDRQIAGDLVQETFYRFLRAQTTHENETHRRNSLYRIATNLARDERRRKLTRIPESAGGDEIEYVSGGGQTASAETHTDVTRAMSLLKPNERAMLWLAYAEGASHNEIAEVLGVKSASMKSLLFRARRRLAGLLERERKADR